MPDERPKFNPMQANLGLGYAPGPVGMPTPTPADTSLRLMQQATVQTQQAQQSSAAAASFGQQFRQRLQHIQGQQSMSPYAAQMMAQNMPGSPQYQGGMLPSPLTMTPAGTGVFRPPVQAPSHAPVPPMYVPRRQWSPFTSQMPSPMFRSPYEQQAQAQDIQGDRTFSYAAQAPRFAAQAAAIGGGAWAGRRLAQRFGMRGRMGMVGMAAGAVAMGASGIAEGLGNIADFSTMPARETRQMGAAAQRMSRDWVVTGPQLHAEGRGLTREAGIQFGGAMREMAGDEGFQQQTGGMFNRQDLMQITRQGGQAGLLDMAQSVPQIKQQIRTTAVTIRQFMELTNDPDVSNVIRQLGQLRQYGMTQQEMVTAAQGMKTFARAAGTTIGGVQQMGGLPGAMTFQQAGLSPGTGFQYGNFAAASARQLIASGGISPRQQALMGGISGITQRDIQAQASLGSMPLFGAAMGQYGAGGWGVNAGAQVGGGGAQGMVRGAIGALGQGARQGGLGALATFPLAQREIQDEALSRMTPQEQMAQRFQLAMSTGQQLGLRGKGAFGAGARVLYGDEIATQMMHQAESPGFWRAQQQMVQGRQRELAYNQRQQIMADAPILGGIPRDIAAATGITEGIENIQGAGRGVGRGISEFGAGVGGLFGGIAESWRQRSAGQEGVLRTKLPSGAGGALAGMRGATGRGADYSDVVKATSKARGAGDTRLTGIDIPLSGQAVLNAINLQEQGATGVGAQVADIMGAPLNLFGAEFGASAAMIGVNVRYSEDEQYAATRKYMNEAQQTLNIIDRAKKVGGVTKNVRSASMKISNAGAKKDIPGLGLDVLRTAGDKLDKLVYTRGSYGETIVDSDYRKVLQDAIMESGAGKISKAEAQKMVGDLTKDPEAIREIKTQMTHYAKENSRDASIWLGTQEGDTRSSIIDQLSTATEARLEDLQAKREGLEETMGLDPFLDTYSEEEERIQQLASKSGGATFALLTAESMMTSGKSSSREKAMKMRREVQRKFNLSDKEMEAASAEAKRIQADDPSTTKRLRELGERSTVGVQQLTEYSLQQRRAGTSAAFGSAGFLEAFAPYSKDLAGFLTTEGSEVTARTVAEQFSEEELGRMAKGGGKARQRAVLLRRAKGKGKEAEAAQSMLTKIAIEESKVGEGGVEETEATKAEGAEAQALARSEEAMGDMGAVFSDFRPAAKEFAQGARMLREAMNSDMISDLIKGGT